MKSRAAVAPACMLAAMETSRDLLLYCRAGFERECAQEISAAEAATRTRCDIGFVEAQLSPAVETNELRGLLDWRRLIFARQCLPVFARIDGLSRTDRLAPIIAALNDRGEAYFDVWVEAPDTDAGKALAPFCRSFGNALIGGLKKARLLTPGGNPSARSPSAPGRSPSAAEAMDGRQRPPRHLGSCPAHLGSWRLGFPPESASVLS